MPKKKLKIVKTPRRKSKKEILAKKKGKETVQKIVNAAFREYHNVENPNEYWGSVLMFMHGGLNLLAKQLLNKGLGTENYCSGCGERPNYCNCCDNCGDNLDYCDCCESDDY